MGLTLAENVRVRGESWGLLFYLRDQHRIYFARSQDWLSPSHFDGTWTFDRLVEDIAQRTTKTPNHVLVPLQKLIDRLVGNGAVVR